MDTERSTPEKNEYFQGEVFAMSGASIAHNKVSSNCMYELKSKLKEKPCRPYGSDLRIHIPKNTLYTYPDLSIICGEVETLDDTMNTAINPSVIIEILSKSTRNYDQGQKIALYRQTESLKEYILIDSEGIQVIKHVKNNDGSWLLMEYTRQEDHFFIDSIQVELA